MSSSPRTSISLCTLWSGWGTTARSEHRTHFTEGNLKEEMGANLQKYVFRSNVAGDKCHLQHTFSLSITAPINTRVLCFIFWAISLINLSVLTLSLSLGSSGFILLSLLLQRPRLLGDANCFYDFQPLIETVILYWFTKRQDRCKKGIKVALHKSNEEQEILIKIIFLKFIYHIVVHPFHNSLY